jgi:MFS family permease
MKSALLAPYGDDERRSSGGSRTRADQAGRRVAGSFAPPPPAAAAAWTAGGPNPLPLGARLCDTCLFDTADALAMGRRGSVWMLGVTQLISSIAACILSAIIPQLRAQYFKSGHAAANASGWTDSLAYCIGFLAAAIIGRWSDCHGRRPIMILQSLIAVLNYACLVLLPQLGGNLWFYIVATMLSKIVASGGAVSSAYIAVRPHLPD